MVEFTPGPCFKHFGDAVSDARRAGDADPRKAIIAVHTMKLVSFFVSFFGGLQGRGSLLFSYKNPFLLNVHFFFLFLFLGGQFRLRKNHYQPAEAQECGILQ